VAVLPFVAVEHSGAPLAAVAMPPNGSAPADGQSRCEPAWNERW